MGVAFKSLFSIRPASLTLGTVLVVVMLFLSGLAILDLIELKTYDLGFLPRGQLQPPPAVVMAALDTNTSVQQNTLPSAIEAAEWGSWHFIGRGRMPRRAITPCSPRPLRPQAISIYAMIKMGSCAGCRSLYKAARISFLRWRSCVPGI